MRYRVSWGGLSAGLERQLATWERAVAKLTPSRPSSWPATRPPRAYQLRYLARRAMSAGDGHGALRLLRAGLATSPRPLVEEPVKSAVTLAAALALAALGPRALPPLRTLASRRAP